MTTHHDLRKRRCAGRGLAEVGLAERNAGDADRVERVRLAALSGRRPLGLAACRGGVGLGLDHWREVEQRRAEPERGARHGLAAVWEAQDKLVRVRGLLDAPDLLGRDVLQELHGVDLPGALALPRRGAGLNDCGGTPSPVRLGTTQPA